MLARWSLSFLILLACVSISNAQEMIPNGTFETGTAKGRPLGWSEFTIDTVKPPQLTQNYVATGGMGNSKCIQVGHSYERFAELTYSDEDYARYKVEKGSAISVDPNAFYHFSIWYKTPDGITDGQISIELDWLNDTAYIDSYIYAFDAASDWTQINLYFRPLKSSDRGFEDENGNKNVNATKLRIKLGVVSAMGTALFDNASMVPIDQATYNANSPLNTFTPAALGVRRKKPPMLQARGVWSIQRNQNSYWFVSPQGRPMWLRAVQNIGLTGSLNPEFYSNLNPAFKGDSNHTNELYKTTSMVRLSQLGFNSNTVKSADVKSQHPEGEAFIVSLVAYPGTTTDGGYYDPAWLLRDKNGDYDHDNKPMPDPWNPAFRSWRRAHTRAILDEHLEDYIDDYGNPHEDFLGYWTDNEMGVEHLDKFIWSTYAQAAFIQFCRTLYNNNIASLNTAWSSQYATFNFSSFDQIPTRKADIVRHHLDDPLTPALNLFIIEMFKELYRVNCAAIREYEVEKMGDTNGDGISEKKHLIATNRYEFSRYPNRYTIDMDLAVIALSQLVYERPNYYFDFIAVNNYPGDGRQEGINTPDNFKYLESLCTRTGLPVVISEFGVHGRDAGFPTGNDTTGDIGWFWRSVNTQADRGKTYDKMMRQWASSPYVLGAQWFQWYDLIQDSSGGMTSPASTSSAYYRGRNCGVVGMWNQYYTGLTDQMAITNAAIETAYAVNSSADPAWAIAE